MMALARAPFRVILLALSFYTRLPTPFIHGSPKELGASFLCLPLVGAVLGAILWIGYFFCQGILPEDLLVFLMLALSVLLTGGLHEDGLADFCDGFGNRLDKERTMAIMKDSRTGVFGLLGLWGVLGIRFQCLKVLDPTHLGTIFFASQIISRSWMMPFLAFLPYAGSRDSFSAQLTRVPALSLLWPVFFMGLMPVFFFSWQIVWTSLVVGLVLSLMLGLWWWRRIRGYTGDCLGAAQQLHATAFELILVLNS
jgi:adenosylcobinamide-GDP ribazoletransferase